MAFKVILFEWKQLASYQQIGSSSGSISTTAATKFIDVKGLIRYVRSVAVLLNVSKALNRQLDELASVTTVHTKIKNKTIISNVGVPRNERDC